jgi:hypothetical protein
VIGSLNNANSILGKRRGNVIDTSSALANDRIELSGELLLVTHRLAHCVSSFRGMQLTPLQEHAEFVAQAGI